MRCIFSPPVLAAIVSAGHEVVAVITPGPAGAPPLTWSRRPGARPGISLAPEQDGLDGIAARRQLPIGQIASIDDSAAIETLAALRPEIIVVACFPQLLPDALLSIAPHGGFNLHPSLLPSLRGPEPIFWALRNGFEETGVTAHRLTDHLTPGISTRRSRSRFHSARESVKSNRCWLRKRLKWQSISFLRSHIKRFVRRAQCASESTYAPFPTMTTSSFHRPGGLPRVRVRSSCFPTGEPLIVEQQNGSKTAVRDAINRFPRACQFRR